MGGQGDKGICPLRSCLFTVTERAGDPLVLDLLVCCYSPESHDTVAPLVPGLEFHPAVALPNEGCLGHHGSRRVHFWRGSAALALPALWIFYTCYRYNKARRLQLRLLPLSEGLSIPSSLGVIVPGHWVVHQHSYR